MERLIDEAFLSKLGNLRFIARRKGKGHIFGAHPSPRAGMSLEFADYRPYTLGDDFRYVDWNVYGRLDRILVKRFTRESDLPVYILLDLSSSMRLGTSRKAAYAVRLAAALAYLGLRSLDRVGLYPFTDRLGRSIPPHHGMIQMSRILSALARLEPGGKTSIDRASMEFCSHTREGGLVFLISDFLSPYGYEEGLDRLLHRGHEPVAIQVLAPDELHPTGSGRMQLIDVETNRRIRLTVGRSTITSYERRLTEHLARLKRVLFERRIPYFLASTDRPIERLIHEDLRRGGVIE